MQRFTIKNILIVLTLAIGIEAKMTLPSDSSDAVIWTIPEKKLPLPSTVSEEVRNVLSKIKQPNVEPRRAFSTKTKEEWKDLIQYSRESGKEDAQHWAEKYKVKINRGQINGVSVFYLTPQIIDPKMSKKLFLFIHGGAYIFGGGMSGLKEGILIAHRTQMPVIAIDYRMPPDYPYPIAIEDVVHVYRSLLEKHSASSMAIGGSSSGAGLTLASIQKIKKLKLILPGALFIGSPWSDLSKSGDSLFVNEGIDRKIVTYDGFIEAAAKLYANGNNLKEPGLSPAYGDFSGFPPTMLVSGTRDLFLSLTVRVHRKMKAEGVTADLNIYEGLSHVEYFVVSDAPESIEVYRELKKFIKQYLK